MAGSLKTLLAFIDVLVILTAIVSCQAGLNDSLITDSTLNDSTTLPNTPAVENSDQFLANASSALEVPSDVAECSSAREKCGFQLYDQFTRQNVGSPIFHCKCSAGYECLYDKDVRGKFYEYRCNGTVEESVRYRIEQILAVTAKPQPSCDGGIFTLCGFQIYRNDTKDIFEENFFCACGEGLQCRFEKDDEENNKFVHRCDYVPEPVSEQVESATPPLSIERRNGEL